MPAGNGLHVRVVRGGQEEIAVIGSLRRARPKISPAMAGRTTLVQQPGETPTMYRATKDIMLPTTITGSLPRPS
jgi:hypothetical protein